MNAPETIAPLQFPAELMDRPQWLVWKFIQKPGQKKPAKMPYYATTGELRGWPHGKPHDGNATDAQPQVDQGHELDRAHLVDFETAMEAAALREFDGVGFAFLPGDGLIGIDLDIHDDAEKQVRADAIVKACASWAETSPSGKGVHIIVRGETETFKHNGIGVEVFCGRQFFTMTGNALPGAPAEIAEIRPDVLAKLRNTVQRAKDADRAAKDAQQPQQPVGVPADAPAYSADEADRVRRYCTTALMSAADAVKRTTEGGRNDALNMETFGVASLMWHGVLGEAQIRAVMTEAGEAVGLPAGEVRATVNSAIRAGSEKRKPVPDPTFKGRSQAASQQPTAAAPRHDPETGEILDPAEPRAANDNDLAALPAPMNIFAEFPAPSVELGMLPDVIADYASECGALIGVEPAMVAIPALVACAAALHDDVRIQPKRHETGWTESARLWCAIVGTPSVKKTPAVRRATKRLRKIDIDLAEENGRLAAAYADQAEQYKDAKKEAKKSGGLHGVAPEKPPMRRMIVGDTTVEALSEVLKDNARGVLCIQDELSGWFGMMDAYTGGKAGNKDRAAWLEAYNGGPRQVDRVMRGSMLVPNWSVSMIGGIQPDAIRRIANNMTDDGLMQRFMIVVGRNAVEHDRVEDGEAVQRYAALVDHLHAVQPGNQVVTLSEDAHAVRERLMRYAGELAEYPALPGGLRSHLGKWSGLFARLLLIYHAIECSGERRHPTSRQVGGQCAERVESLMRGFLLPHALAYYTDILGASGDLEHARWVAGHILSKGLEDISNRDLVQSYKQWRGLSDWQRQRIMQVLEDMSWLAPVVDEGRPSRRGTTQWRVNLRVHEMFAKKATDEAEKRDRIRAEIAAMQRRA